MLDLSVFQRSRKLFAVDYHDRDIQFPSPFGGLAIACGGIGVLYRGRPGYFIRCLFGSSMSQDDIGGIV